MVSLRRSQESLSFLAHLNNKNIEYLYFLFCKSTEIFNPITTTLINVMYLFLRIIVPFTTLKSFHTDLVNKRKNLQAYGYKIHIYLGYH